MSSIDIKKFSSVVRSLPMFSKLTDDEFEQIEQHIKVRTFSKNQLILAEEDTSRYMYVVCSGKVKVTQTKSDGREQTLATHGKGDFFGEMSLLDGHTIQANVMSIANTTVAFIEQSFFKTLISTNPNVLQQVISLLCWRLRDAWGMVKILSQPDVEQRLRLVLIHFANKYGIPDGRGIIITLPLTHREVANHAALARETVTRVMGRLVEHGELEILENRRFFLTKEFLKKSDFGDFNHIQKQVSSDIVTIKKQTNYTLFPNG